MTINCKIISGLNINEALDQNGILLFVYVFYHLS